MKWNLAPPNHSPLSSPSFSMMTLQHWVSAFVGGTSAQRGMEYFREGRAEVESASTHEGSTPEEIVQTIRGQVRGYSLAPYQVWASLVGDVITDAHCSCPIGQKGQCKHVAALLISAKAPPEQHVQILSAPAPSNTATEASPTRQLYAGRFSATLQPQTSPASLFRVANSPKKSIWGYSHTSPTSAAPVFSPVTPGFSLKAGAHIFGARDNFDLPQSQLGSPQKGKHLVFHPLSATQGEPNDSSSVPNASTSTQRTPSPETDSSAETHKFSSPPSSAPAFPQAPHSTPVAPSSSQDSLLQDELTSQKGYTAVLEKECEVLREKVRFLQMELARKANEILTLKASLQETVAKKPASSMDVDQQSQQQQQQQQPTQVVKQENPARRQEAAHTSTEVHHFMPSQIHLPPSKTTEALKDSIEDSEEDVPPSSPYKKRARDFEPEDQPGFTKRFSVGVSTSPAGAEPTTHAISAAAPPVEAPQLCSVDSQALLDAMSAYEEATLPKPVTAPNDSLNLSLSTPAPSSTPPVPSHFNAPNNSLNSSAEDSDTTGGSKSPPPSSPLLPAVSTLVTQQPETSPSFMVLSQ